MTAIVEYINNINKATPTSISVQKYYIRPKFTNNNKPEVTSTDFTKANRDAMNGLMALSEFANSAFYSTSTLQTDGDEGIIFAFNYPTFQSKTEYYKDTTAQRPTTTSGYYSRFQGVSEITYGTFSFPKIYYFSPATRQQNNYPQKAFIGLFTTMPNPDGTGYAEPTPYSEDAPNLTYRRMNLHESLFNGEPIFGKVEKVCDDKTEADHFGKAKIKNKDLIMFPEVLGASWGTIKGFGIFNEEAVGTGTPYFWGSVQQSKVASEETVPLFRPEEFIIYLG